ncbi:hypothetical protein IF1G_05777 [Cordyceps javanica]|uniref:Uncharacterized protein n=1 Tax=Cordyceps javanica TaxID=43265 RepID=A0A545V2K2_9HYPO|nr:hypothetical protein IF1G_05777 [Cordyceps javanica]
MSHDASLDSRRMLIIPAYNGFPPASRGHNSSSSSTPQHLFCHPVNCQLPATNHQLPTSALSSPNVIGRQLPTATCKHGLPALCKCNPRLCRVLHSSRPSSYSPSSSLFSPSPPSPSPSPAHHRCLIALASYHPHLAFVLVDRLTATTSVWARYSVYIFLFFLPFYGAPRPPLLPIPSTPSHGCGAHHCKLLLLAALLLSPHSAWLTTFFLAPNRPALLSRTPPLPRHLRRSLRRLLAHRHRHRPVTYKPTLPICVRGQKRTLGARQTCRTAPGSALPLFALSLPLSEKQPLASPGNHF